jgi:hypothetical protein
MYATNWIAAGRIKMNGQSGSFGAKLRTLLNCLSVAPLLAATLSLPACGGGGYGGMSMSPPPTTTPAVKSSVTVGAITGFGAAAVKVNGIQFQSAGATVSIDGKSAQPEDLRAGEVVQIKSHHDDATDEDVADEIDFRGNVVGPVSAVDPVAQTLLVLGQVVVLSATTSFDEGISPASLAGVHAGDILEISGMSAADGSIQATRIERKPSAGTFQVSGVVSSTDAAAMTLHINALVVDFSSATLSDFPSTGPKDGDIVEAAGTTIEASGTLLATRLELLGGAAAKPPAETTARVEGLITRFVSSADFDVAGHAVSTSAATEFEGGTAADLILNAQVEVEGSVDAAGVIEASKVRIDHAADVRIMAQVDAVDAAAGTVALLGIQVTVSATTRFEDHGSEDMHTFDLTTVQVGDWLEVRGVSTDGTSVAATRIDRLAPQSAVCLAGPVTAAAAPTFSILSTPVMTSDATQFSDGLDATTFFDSLIGHLATVRGSWDGSTLNADRAQLGQHDDGGDDD